MFLYFPLILFLLISIDLPRRTWSALFFEIRHKIPNCFYEELYKSTVILWKWKIVESQGMQIPPEALKSTIKSVVLFVYDELEGSWVFQNSISEIRGKTSFSVKTNGLYKICASLKIGAKKKYNWEMNWKIATDSDDDSRISNSIKSNQVNKLQNKINGWITKMKTINEGEKDELSNEDISAKQTIDATKWFKMFTIMQIVFSIMIVGLQWYIFTKYLKKINVV